jgi:hypothetical protein
MIATAVFSVSAAFVPKRIHSWCNLCPDSATILPETPIIGQEMMKLDA